MVLAGLAVGCGGSTQPAEGSAGTSGDCSHDGKTYALGEQFASSDGCNSCTCSEAGVACTERACLPEKACGARAGATCDESEYCAYEPGAYCGEADAQASCKPRPTGCDDVLSPVCGCDKVTYPNACSANTAGQGVYAAGECAAP